MRAPERWEAPPPDGDGPLGEDPCIRERVVVSPATGTFQPAPASGDGRVRAGTVLGWVAGEAITSPFAGELMGLLVPPGSPIFEGEPVAWLRP